MVRDRLRDNLAFRGATSVVVFAITGFLATILAHRTGYGLWERSVLNLGVGAAHLLIGFWTWRRLADAPWPRGPVKPATVRLAFWLLGGVCVGQLIGALWAANGDGRVESGFYHFVVQVASDGVAGRQGVVHAMLYLLPMLVVTCFTTPLVEEVVFCRAVLSPLRTRVGQVSAEVTSIAIFAAVHVLLRTVPALHSVLIWCALRWIFNQLYLTSGKVGWAVCGHAFWNATMVLNSLIAAR